MSKHGEYEWSKYEYIKLFLIKCFAVRFTCENIVWKEHENMSCCIETFEASIIKQNIII